MEEKSILSINLPEDPPYKYRGPPELANEFYLKDPVLLDLYKRSLPQKEAYYFFPKGEDVFIPHSKKPQKSLRYIFLNVPYTENEQKWLTDYKKVIESHPENEIPSFWNDGWNLNFIYSTECNLTKAYERMLKYIDWLNNRFPIYIEPEDKALKLLNSGFVYVYGRDSRFHPIIICQPYILEKALDQYSLDDIERGSFFLTQYVQNKMLIPGQIENWIMAVNLKHLNLLKMPDPFKKIIIALSDNYPGRLFKAYIFNMSRLMRILFLFVSAFLEEITLRKVVIIKDSKDKNLFKDFNSKNLEKKFGGEAPDVEYDTPNGLFPPRMPCPYFFLENQNPQEELIREDEYLDKLKKGLIPKQSVSPFIIEKINKMKKAKEDKKKEKEFNRTLLKNNFLNSNFKKFKELTSITSWKVKKESFDLSKFRPFETETNCVNEVTAFSQRKNSFCKTLTTLGNKNGNVNKPRYQSSNKYKNFKP